MAQVFQQIARKPYAHSRGGNTTGLIGSSSTILRCTNPLLHFSRFSTSSYFRGISESEMAKERKNRKGVEGMNRFYLEERLLQLSKDGNWQTIVDVIGLLIYGILLFPHLEDYVDLITMEIFLAKRDKGENPTMAILANTYPLITTNKIVFPIEDFKWSWVKPMSKEQWVKHLSEASKRTIRWYPTWYEQERVILGCGGYPNVPLLGTQGAINYNPELILRQVGYPMTRAPLEEAMTPLMLHGSEAHKEEHHRKIRHA
ncbi:hypothetical protein CR513_61758, partial [Mucuna pruriens]